ncbi:MAG: sirohydrochlorin chelatase [Bacillota bacterium]
MSQAVLMIGHGSRERAGNQQFLELAGALAERLAPLPVAPAFLDHAQPSIQAAIDGLEQRGVREVRVVPLFLFAAGHAKLDVPRELAAARRRHPHLAFRHGRVLGVEPALVAVCAQRLAAAEAGDPCRSETAVLLVGRGSSDAEANRGLRQVAGLLQGVTGCARVESAYCDVAPPSVEEGLARCLALGARRVVLLPYFLFRGVLMCRLQATLARWQADFPGVDFRLAGAEGLAQGGALLDLLVERVEELASTDP